MADDGTVRGPEDQALANFLVDMEELQFLAEATVVALLRLFGPNQGLLELFLRRERGAINTLQLLILLVAAVVGARDVQQFEGLDLRRIADVRAGTEVDELTVLIKGNRLAGGDVAEAANLVGNLTALAKEFVGFF